MRKLLLIAFLAVMCLGVGLVLSCGDDDDDDDSSDDDGGDDDDCDMDNPMPSSECDSFCNADNCSIDNPAFECIPGNEGYASVDECISDCMAQCQQGCIPANAQDCFDAFTDCDAWFECMGINGD